jgi:hypothetical protein
MAEQVDVCINNLFDSASIEVFREFPDGNPEPGSNVTIDAGGEGKILLYEPGIRLIITPSIGVDFRTCWLNVTRNVHLVSWEVMEDHWEMQIADNSDPPEVPIEVHVEVGGNEL